MNILNVRYSINRKTQYQIKTTIFEEYDTTYVCKEPYSELANDHIKNIYNNYILLSKSLLNTIKPQYKNNKIFFPFIEGKNFAQILIKDITEKNRKEFINKLLWYKALLLKEEQTLFFETEDFKKIFGSYPTLKGLNSFKVSNIDLNFENIILDKDGKEFIIDYEWVFNFPIPIDYVIYRAITQFVDRYSSILNNFITLEEMFNILDINSDRISIYEEMEKIFLNYVGSTWFEQRKNYLKPIIRKDELFNNTFSKLSEREQYIQVFWDINNSFNENDSKLIKVDEYKKKKMYEIELPENSIKSLRIDPGNFPSFVRMRVFLIDFYREIEITKKFTLSDAVIFVDENGDKLEFITKTNDPQLIFNNINLQSGKKKLKIEFFIISDELELQDILFSVINQKNKNIEALKEKNIKLNNLIEIRDKELERKDSELLLKEEKLKSKTEELEKTNNLYQEIISSKGWRILEYLRKFKI